MLCDTDKYSCCGCESCVQVCPVHCIEMQMDGEGFRYPVLSKEKCLNCGLCEKVCPVLNNAESEVLSVFASWNEDSNVREESSSGGVFSILAQKFMNDGGAVFGAVWNKDWQVDCTCAESYEELDRLRSSKYVQSHIGNSYREAEKYLKSGKKVLFSGTPCQVAGLKAFLQKEYENLFCVECVCHGVPSPGLWNKYLTEVSNGRQLVKINHRSKETGWRNYSVLFKFSDGSAVSQHHDDNVWTRSFIKNFTLRPSCYSCSFKNKTSGADVTLGDLWGSRNLLPFKDDDTGISLVVCRSEKGRELTNSLLNIADLTFEQAVEYNKALMESPSVNPKRNLFFQKISSGCSFSNTAAKLTRDPLKLRLKKHIKACKLLQNIVRSQDNSRI